MITQMTEAHAPVRGEFVVHPISTMGASINIAAITQAFAAIGQQPPGPKVATRDANKRIVMARFPNASTYKAHGLWNVGIYHDGTRIALARHAPSQREMWAAAVRALKVAGVPIEP
jgi:hypothetical protein